MSGTKNAPNTGDQDCRRESTTEGKRKVEVDSILSFGLEGFTEEVTPDWTFRNKNRFRTS